VQTRAACVLCYWRIFVHIRQAKLRLLQARNGRGGGGSASMGAWSTQAAMVKTIRQIKVRQAAFHRRCDSKWEKYNQYDRDKQIRKIKLY